MKEYIESFVTFLLTRQCASLHTAAAYRRDAEQFIRYTARATKTKDGELRAHIVNFRDYLVKQGISARSIARKLSSLRSFFRFLSEQVSPTTFKEHTDLSVGAPPRIDKQLPRACSNDDLKALFEAARHERLQPVRSELICMLLYTAGLRVSELVAIRCDQINLSAQILTIIGKGGKTRTVPLIAPVIELLKQYMVTIRCSGSMRLFSINRHSVWRIIRRLTAKAKISRTISPHMLRHSFATDSLKEGWDLRSLQKFLGHEKITTTEMYIHLNTQFISAEYKKKHPRGK